MNFERGLAIASLALVVLLLGSSAAAAQSNRGFAAYKVSVTTPKGAHSVLINETVGPSDKAGYSDLILQFVGTEQNFTYSRFVNASEDFLPYLPAVTNQSFQYNNGTAIRISARVTTTGTTSVTFKGSQYTLNVLSITASVRFGNMSAKANGTVETFPSTLVYSANVGNSTDRLQAVLEATDLPLSGPSQMTTAAAVSAGIGIGAVAIVGALLFRRREHRVATQGEKPLHWVD
jgi:lipoprotein signal peptidase